jgi:hypothetical protein
MGKTMKTIYLIAAHHSPDQFGALAQALQGSLLFAHIDAKSDGTPFRDSVKGSHVQFVPDVERVAVKWGGWSQVESTLALLRLARGRIDPADRLVLLSGDSYPLRSGPAIDRHFQQQRDAEFINCVSMPSVEASKPLSRLTRLFVEYDPRDGSRHITAKFVNALKLPRSLKRLGQRAPHAGSTWWALTGACAIWILDQIDDDPKLVPFFKRSKMPDESFFQTLVANSPYSANIRPGVMYTDWSGPVKPAVLSVEHVKNLALTGLVVEQTAYGRTDVLFARKVLHQEVRDAIETSLMKVDVQPQQVV